MCGCLLCAPHWGPSLQPRHMPEPGTEPVAGWCSIHRATPARAKTGTLHLRSMGVGVSGACEHLGVCVCVCVCGVCVCARAEGGAPQLSADPQEWPASRTGPDPRVWERKLLRPTLHLDAAEEVQDPGPPNLSLTLTCPGPQTLPNSASGAGIPGSRGGHQALPGWCCGCPVGVPCPQSRPLEQFYLYRLRMVLGMRWLPGVREVAVGEGQDSGSGPGSGV